MEPSATTCPEVRGWLSAHVAGRLGVTEWALLEVHLAQCMACRRELQQLQESKSPPRQSLLGFRPTVALTHAGIRHGTRGLTWLELSLAMSSRWARHIGVKWIASIRRLARVPMAASCRWFLPRMGGVIGWVGLGPTAYRRLPLWRPRTAIGWRSTRRTDVMTDLVRVGTGFVILALVGTLVCLSPPDLPPQSAPGVSPPNTTVIPTATPPVEHDAPVRRRPSEAIQPNTGGRTTSPGPPKKPAEIPLPVRIPAAGPSSSPPASPEDSPSNNQDAAMSQKASSEPAAALDWLLKDERRNQRSLGRSGSP